MEHNYNRDLVSSGSNIFSDFFRHMFLISTDHKLEYMNLFQYIILSIIPVVLLNKTIATYIPPADELRSSFEIGVELLLQILLMFGGIIFIHRFIIFIPTYSGEKYEPLCLTHVIIAFMIILFSIQSKLSSKVNILVDRALDMWNGNKPLSAEAQENQLRQQMSRPPIEEHKLGTAPMSVSSANIEDYLLPNKLRPATSSGVRF